MVSPLLTHAIALLSGTIFGIGLLLSGMANPNKVLGFFDITGQWDPSLILVMLGAVVTSSVAFVLLKNRTATYLDLPIHQTTKTNVDQTLIWGSAVFGVGWGLTGICPGPGVILVGLGLDKGFVFLFSVLTGFVVYAIVAKVKL